MNSIEHLNQLGGQLLTFAWPMFWQSSLLIGLVFAMDRLLARKVRAAVRHALWVVVLFKLLLPPSLALPTGVAWWLFPAEPAVKAPVPRNFVVTVGDAPRSENFMPLSVPPVSPPPKLDGAGWMLLAMGAVSLGLTGWLLFRGGQVARMVRRAAPADGLAHMLGQVQRAAGLRRPLRLKMVEDRTSPAVAGLLRPVILLPRMVAEKLSAEQLRAVLLHEAMHLRRGDLWTNCAQALLQSLYWWHPLVWLANARLRRLREEAVDDAVMLALADDAEIYAPTLLEVARLAFRRPLLSLGLVGILESRSALRQRIERLVAFRAPRRAGLSLVSLLAILGFSAVALPMGQGPAPAARQPAVATNQQGDTDATPGQPFPRPMVLIQAEIYQVPPGKLKRLVSDLPTVKVPGHGANHSQASEATWWSASPAQYLELSGRLKASGLKPEQRPRIQTCSGKPAQFFVGDTIGKEILDGTEIDCLPVVRDGKIQLNFTSEVMEGPAGARLTNRVEGDWELSSHGGLVVPLPNDAKHRVFFLTAEVLTNALQAQSPPGRSNIVAKLDQIHLHQVSFDGLSLKAVADQLTEASRQNDPEKQGIRVSTVTNSLMSQWDEINSVRVLIPSLADVRLAEVLDAVVLVGDHPIKYSIQDDGVVFQAAAPPGDPLVTRTFRVDPETFYANLSREETAAGVGPPKAPDPLHVAIEFRRLTANSRIYWDSPRGKSIVYNTNNGILFVKATKADLDTVGTILQRLSPSPPQLHIKAIFIKLPEDAVGGMKWLAASTNVSAGGITALLTSENARAVLQALETRRDADVLGEPEITSLSGRRDQMRATEVTTIVTNIAFHDNSTDENDIRSYAIEPQTTPLETGPILDAVPRVLDDHYTIDLTATGSLIEFLGYASATNAVGDGWPSDWPNAVTNATGERVNLPVILPVVQIRSSSTHVNLRDGQTVVLSLSQAQARQVAFNGQGTWREALVAQYIERAKKKNGQTEVLAFITVTIIDPAGNRIHNDDGMLLAPGALPPQPDGPK